MISLTDGGDYKIGTKQPGQMINIRRRESSINKISLESNQFKCSNIRLFQCFSVRILEKYFSYSHYSHFTIDLTTSPVHEDGCFSPNRYKIIAAVFTVLLGSVISIPFLILGPVIPQGTIISSVVTPP